MPSFTDFLLFLLAWFILAVFVVALLNIIKWQYGKSYSTTVHRNFLDMEVNIYILGDLPNPNERIFSVDSSGETISNHEHHAWPMVRGTVITVDDNEDLDMFRKAEYIDF